MKPDQISAVVDERLARWGRFLREEEATPTVIVGLGWPGARRDRHEAVITCPEGMSNDQVVEQLQVAIALIRAGRERRP